MPPKRKNMKKLIPILLLQIAIINFIFAQEIYVEIKNEFSSSDVKFKWDSNLNNQSGADELSYNFSIGLSGKLYKNIFLKSTIGSNDFKNLIKIEWNSENAEHQILGWISANQNYLEILPEIRFLKDNWLFVNMGIGFSQIRTSKFVSGYYRRNSEFYYEEDEFPNFNGKYEYFALNFGANIHYKNFGIIVEFGTRRSGFTRVKTEIPGLGINQINIKLGISYRLN
jgi:hypothetical protein